MTFSLIGDHILMIETAGLATARELEEALALDSRIKDEFFPKPGSYVRIEHWSKLYGTSRRARDIYGRYIRSDQRLLGLVYLGLQPYFKLAIKLASLVTPVRFPVSMADGYFQAVTRACRILSEAGFQAAPAASPAPPASAGTSFPPGSSGQAVIRDDWRIEGEGFSIQFEVLEGNVLHAVTTGVVRETTLLESIRLRERIVQALTASSPSYAFIVGLNSSPGISPRARKIYVASLRELYRKYPFRQLVFYGANRSLRAAINLSRPFVPFKTAIAEDLNQALNLIDAPGALPAPKGRRRKLPPVASPVLPAEIGGYVQDVLSFLEGLDWDRAGKVSDLVQDPSHPFAPVFEAIGLMKWEIDDLLREQQRNQEGLIQAKEAAEMANRAKSSFLSNMSHELRTPLSAVIGFADLIQEKAMGPLTAKQEQYIRLIGESGRHLLALINEVLDLAKVESGTMPLELGPVDVPNLLEHSLTLFRETCLKHDLHPFLDIKEEAQGIIAVLDERKVRQVLYNLLSNAVKFTPDGGRIGIEAAMLPARDDGPKEGQSLPALQISVVDTGIGLAPEHHEKVFESFYQVQGGITNKTRGAGLGLAIVRQMVELHGGKAWVESEGPGKGSAFRFTLPLRPVELRDSSARTEVAEGPAIDEPKAAQERIAYWLATYREALGRFSIGRIWPTATSVQVNRDAALKELDLAKRSGDAVLIDPQGDFILLLRADTASAQTACRRLVALLKSRMGGEWSFAVAEVPGDGGASGEFPGTILGKEASPS